MRMLWWVLLGSLLAGCGSPKPAHQGKTAAELEQMLADPDPTVQAQGAYGLASLGPVATPAVPALVRALKAGDTLVRQQAAAALGEVGEGAMTAAGELVVALGDPEWQVRRQAALSLGRLGPGVRTTAADGLARCQRDPHPLVRKAATEALAKLRP